MSSIKEAAQRIVDGLSADATWDDLMYEIYVNKKVGEGDSARTTGQLATHDKARKRVGKR